MMKLANVTLKAEQVAVQNVCKKATRTHMALERTKKHKQGIEVDILLLRGQTLFTGNCKFQAMETVSNPGASSCKN
jgi:hypothetical protein